MDNWSLDNIDFAGLAVLMRHARSFVLGGGLCVLLGTFPVQADDWASRAFGEGHSRTDESLSSARGAKSKLRANGKRSRVNNLASAGELDPDGIVRSGKAPNVLPRPTLPASRSKWQWRISKSQWSDEDERKFAAFVTAIGESDCKTVHDCIVSPAANPDYHATNPPHLKFYSDCADLPYFLRAYFAWKNGLPFSFSVRYAAHPKTPGSTPKIHGNKIVERYDIVGPGPDGRLAVATVGRFVSTEHFRTPPHYNGNKLPDYYPVRLTRESIKPGTVIFDPDGHIAIVYKVTDNGRIFYIDSHPDNSLTRGVYARDFARAEPQMGAGFKRWRPQKLVGAKRAADGSMIGGQIELTADKDLSDWSDEQFYGNSGVRPTDWRQGKFVIGGQVVDYYDYLRIRLAYPGFKYDPIDEVRSTIKGLCEDLHYRAQAIELAIQARVHLRPQPPRLPRNIYATRGDWETYSTPSRDARLKTTFEELREEAARFLRLYEKKSGLLDYSGSNLRADLLAAYREETKACTVTYTKSDGTSKTLGFEEVSNRLFDLSFDPHHCVERRWGATAPEELASCKDDPLKNEWYKAQQRLRFQVTRTYGEVMGWGLAELKNPKLDIGIPEPPDVDTLAVLVGQQEVASTDWVP